MKANNYKSLLSKPKWQKKRLEILNRDNFTCKSCGDTETELQVHHKSYINGNDPWDYNDDNFETLCSKCHKTNHHKVEITENGGFINPNGLVLKFGKFCNCISKIGNHKGLWTVLMNDNDSADNNLRCLSLLCGYTWYDDQYEITDVTGNTISMDYVKQNFVDYLQYFEIGYKMNTDSPDYDETIDIDYIYNNLIFAKL